MTSTGQTSLGATDLEVIIVLGPTQAVKSIGGNYFHSYSNFADTDCAAHVCPQFIPAVCTSAESHSAPTSSQNGIILTCPKLHLAAEGIKIPHKAHKRFLVKAAFKATPLSCLFFSSKYQFNFIFLITCPQSRSTPTAPNNFPRPWRQKKQQKKNNKSQLITDYFYFLLKYMFHAGFVTFSFSTTVNKTQ